METNPNLESQPEKQTLWTTEDVARFFGCTVRHVQNLQKTGLPYFHIGRLVRFDAQEVRTFLRENRQLSANVVRRRQRKAAQD
jgi:phage terminase Nu1 subunit (DNA packaging protein)